MASTAWLDPLVDGCGFGAFQLQLLAQTCAVYIPSAAVFVILGSVSDDLPRARWGMDDFAVSALQSAVFIGMLFGTCLGGYLGDRIGRRPCVLMGYAVMLVAATIMMTSWMYYMMFVGCLLWGAAVGAAVPPYNALLVEATPTDCRGYIICLSTFVFFFGEVYGAACIWFLSEEDVYDSGAPSQRLAWRWALGFGIAPILPTMCYALYGLVESPRFLAAQGRLSEAQAVVRRMAEANGVRPPSFSPFVRARGDLEEQAPPTTSLSSTLKLLSRWPLSGSTLGLSVLCAVINFVYYGMIFSMPQVLDDSSFWGSAAAQVVIVTLCKGPGIVLAMFLVRAPFIGHKASLSCLFCVAGAAAFAYPHMELRYRAVGGALFAACVLKIACAAAFNLLYIFALEVYPTHIRSFGMALCTMMGRFGAIAAPPLYNLLSDEHSAAPYFHALAACCFFASVAALCMPVETKGRPLDEATEGEGQALARKAVA